MLGTSIWSTIVRIDLESCFHSRICCSLSPFPLPLSFCVPLYFILHTQATDKETILGTCSVRLYNRGSKYCKVGTSLARYVVVEGSSSGEVVFVAS